MEMIKRIIYFQIAAIIYLIYSPIWLTIVAAEWIEDKLIIAADWLKLKLLNEA